MENKLVDSVEALMAKIEQVKKAQEIFATYSQEQVDKIFTAAALVSLVRTSSPARNYDVVVLGVCNVHHASDLLIATADNVYGNRIGSLSDSGKVYGTPTRKVYKSPYGDLGSGGFKTVRSIDVTTESDVDIIVVTDGKRHSFRVKGSGLPQTVFVGKSGRKIAVELHSEQAECKLSPLVLKVDFM